MTHHVQEKDEKILAGGQMSLWISKKYKLPCLYRIRSRARIRYAMQDVVRYAQGKSGEFY